MAAEPSPPAAPAEGPQARVDLPTAPPGPPVPLASPFSADPAAPLIEHRAQIASLVILVVGVVWLIVGWAGEEKTALGVGGFFLFAGLLAGLLRRRSS